MRNKLLLYLAFIQLAALPIYGEPEPVFLVPEDDVHITVNNRVLAKVNGKAISAMDVMKKMEMIFYRSFPQYSSSVSARFQFFQVNWKKVLADLIDKELIMADAEEAKVQVSNGDVRQEMESIFGPNIHQNLDKINLSFDEAWKMIHSDIVLKRMMYLKAHSKAMRRVTPQVVRQAYTEYAQSNIRPDIWHYSFITIRDKDPTVGAEAAHQIYKLLAEDKIRLTALLKALKDANLLSASTKVTISEEMRHEEKELAPNYKEILSALDKGTFSQPAAQKSRTDNSTVFRVFYLKEKVQGGIIPFSEVETQIKEKLLDDASEEETEAYIKKLRKHFDVQETHLLDTDFEPFAIK